MSINHKIDKQTIRDRLFIAAWALYLLSRLLALTEWHSLSESAVFPSILQYAEYLSAGLALLVIILNFILRKYSWKAFIAYGILAAVIGLSAYFSDNKTYILVFLVLGAAYGQSGKRILVISAFLTATVIIVVVLCSQIGLSQNVIWYRWGVDQAAGKIRESLGFLYASTGASLYFGFILQYIFLRKERMRVWEFAILEVGQVFFFLKTDSRLPFYFGTAVISFFLIETMIKNHWYFLRHLKGLVYAIPGVLCAIAIGGYYLYDSSSSFWIRINDFLSNRMVLGVNALYRYGIKILGQPVIWIGNGSGKIEGTYNYVDCSYLQILIQYGVLLLLGIMVLYTIGTVRAYKAQDFWLVALFVSICIYSITEPYLLNLAVIPLPLLAVAQVGEEPIIYKKGWVKQILYSPSDKKADASPKERTLSVKKNFVMNTILTVSSFVFPLITFPYISRVLLADGTGTVSFAKSIIAYFLMISALGIPTYGIRACAQVRDDKEKLSKTAQELLIINILMCLITYILLMLAIFFIPRLREERLLFVVLSSTLFLNAIGMEWLFKALEQYTYITIRSIIFNILGVAFMFLLVHKQGDYIIYGAISVGASSLGYLLNLFYAGKYISLRPIRHYDLKQHIKPVVIFFSMACAITVYTNLDLVMLGFMKNDTEVGYYHAAIRVKEILLAVITSLGTVLLPRLSYYIQNQMFEEFRKTTKKAINFVFLFASPLMMYFLLFAKNGILLLSGSDFMGAVLPMRILLPTLILIGLTNLLGMQILVPLGREKIVLYSVIAGAVVDLILNAFLIPKLGPVGAAIGTLAAEVIVLIVQLIALRKDNLLEAFKEVQYWKMIIAIIAGCAVSFWVVLINIGNIFTLLISAVLFFAAYFAVLLVLKEPMAEGLMNMINTYFDKGKQDNLAE